MEPAFFTALASAAVKVQVPAAAETVLFFKTESQLNITTTESALLAPLNVIVLRDVLLITVPLVNAAMVGKFVFAKVKEGTLAVPETVQVEPLP